MEYVAEHIHTWFRDELLDGTGDDDYVLLDCPGQIELYTHVPVMKSVAESVIQWGGCNVCGVFVLDATFLADVSKFISGTLLALSVMMNMEIPGINVLTKCDLVEGGAVDKMLDVYGRGARDIWHMERGKFGGEIEIDNISSSSKRGKQKIRDHKLDKMTEAICSIIDEYTMVAYIPLDITDEESLDLVLSAVDQMLQYGDDVEFKEPPEAVDVDDK
mmetsp:Transcript_15987/g.35981  ORF Transcript_15987/g.35981 Transcript_15987/m.35981 type:complete len:217 (+) Transcript_15987:620-1270(+)